MKRTYISKIIALTLGIILTAGLFLGEIQNASADSILSDNSKIQLVENTSVKNSTYLKEDINLINFKNDTNDPKINILNEQINSNINSNISKIENQSKETFDIYGHENMGFPYEINVKYTVTNESDSLISLYNDFYSYLGGAHGNTLRNSYTIDKDKKEMLSLNNLFTNGYDYKKIINDDIIKQINSHPENYYESGKQFQGINDEQNFYIDQNNLVIYYQQYEIAPYCYGIPEFKIPLSLFGENYLYNNSIK